MVYCNNVLNKKLIPIFRVPRLDLEPAPAMFPHGLTDDIHKLQNVYHQIRERSFPLEPSQISYFPDSLSCNLPWSEELDLSVLDDEILSLGFTTLSFSTTSSIF